MKILRNLILVFLILITIGCKKNPFDSRTKYLGDYNFFIHQVGYYPGHDVDTTYCFKGKIDYGANKSTIAIYWRNMNEASYPELFEDVSFKGYGCEGDFLSSKKVVFVFGISTSSTFMEWKVSGEKIL